MDLKNTPLYEVRLHWKPKIIKKKSILKSIIIITPESSNLAIWNRCFFVFLKLLLEKYQFLKAQWIENVTFILVDAARDKFIRSETKLQRPNPRGPFNASIGRTAFFFRCTISNFFAWVTIEEKTTSRRRQ